MGMSQSSFAAEHRPTWRRFETMLEELESDHPSMPADEFPRLYRTLCQHLSIARARGYSAGIVERLNALVERGHALLYGSRVGRWDAIVDYAMGGFARDVRRHWPLLLVATLVFVGPYLGMIAWLHAEPDWAYHILGADMIGQMEEMYSTAPGADAERQADSDVFMFGFYIYNNIGIGLRTFGAGILAGIGSIFTLLYNGAILGAVSGHLHNAGLGHNFWPFVVGHGSFELTAIVLSGMAGFKIGFAPIWPGRRTRMQALREEAADSVGLVAGFSAMLLIAAFIEAFWSSMDLAPTIKYWVGGGLWALVIGYFALAGRGDGPR